MKDNKIQTTVYRKSLIATYIYSQTLSPFILYLRNAKGVALRLPRISLTDKEYNNKSKEYKAYLNGRGHKLKNTEKCYNDILNLSRQQSLMKNTKSNNSKSKIVSCSKYNPLGPNIKNIIQKHAHILDYCQIMENKEIMIEGSL